MFTKILIALAVLVVVLVVVVALQPSEFRVTRSATMQASPAAVFAQVNDLHKWPAWSPWAKMDPAMKQTYDGPPAGTGSSSAWVGNKDVGEGRMTILDSRPDQQIRIKLEFYKPFAGTSDVDFGFSEDGGKTNVTWTMTGKNNFIAKAMGLVMNMDKMCGDQFEQGLANLKAIVEPK